MRIDLVSWGETIPGLTLKSESGREPVSALAFRYSTPLSYTGPAIMEIYQKSAGGSAAAASPPAAEAPGDPSDANAAPAKAAGLAAMLAERRIKNPSLVALAALPRSSRRATVLLAPAASGTYQTYVIDDDPSRLPEGKLRIHNLSPFLIAMRCNERTASELKTKQSIIVEPRNREVIYELAYQHEGQWVMQENNITTVRDNEQAQLVVLKSEADFFASRDGSRSGFLQTVVLRRTKDEAGTLPEFSAAETAALLERVKREEEAGEEDPAGPAPSPRD